MLKGMKWRALFIAFFCLIAFCMCGCSMGKPQETSVAMPAETPMGTPAGISAEESDFQIEDGVLTAYMGNDGIVSIPDGVTEIGKEVFQESKIKKVVLPAGVEKIGDSAFSGCKELESVTLPEGLTVMGEFAFYECEKLQDIVLPNSLKTIGFCAFDGCMQLKSVQFPKQLKVIRGWAFSQCYSLEKIIIPESVIRIDSEAFAYCYNLKKVVINSDKIRKVGDYPFLFHAADRKVVFKKKVSKKYKQMFNYQDYIRKGAVLYHKTSSSTVDMCAVKYTKKGKLVVPERVGKYTVTGVKNIPGAPSYVIGYMHEGITEVKLADTITKLDKWVFESAPFTKIKFPANLVRIEEALYDNHLEDIELPEKLEYVGYAAFVRTFHVLEPDLLPEESLVKELPKSIRIPKSVQKIEDGNFGYYRTTYFVEAEDSWSDIRIDGYKIKGEKGSYAQEYAKTHKLKFVAVR